MPQNTEGLPVAIFDLVAEGFGAAFILYDRNDQIVHASAQVLDFYPVQQAMLSPGTRLRDFLAAIFDVALKQGATAGAQGLQSREDWLSERIAFHWRERCESVERFGHGRWLRLLRRRMPNGFGMCLISDVTEEKKREEQWRCDMERVQLTEDILDNLPFPLFVKDYDLSYVAVNRALCEKFRTSADEVLGRTSQELFSPEVAQRFEESDRHVLETGETSLSRQKQVTPDGSERNIVTRKQRIGKPGRYFLVSTMQELPQNCGELDDFLRLDPVVDATGSSFRQAYLPAASEASSSAQDVQLILPEAFLGRRVVVVTAQRSLERSTVAALEKLGFEACGVRSAEELALFIDVAAGADFTLDLILIDNQMEMSCIETAQRHAIAHLTLDPFHLLHELTFRMAQHFNRSKVVRQPASEADQSDWEIVTTPEDVQQLDVLVAEDNKINQIVFSQILESLGYSYAIAESGDEAVRLWIEHKPRIAFMDISLPKMNGLDATRKIRRLEGESATSTPIIGVLTQAYTGDHADCAAAGMNSAIFKPISPELLDGIIRSYINPELLRSMA